MAITRYSTFDKTVQTIADRNIIENKIDGMTVIVLDAIADINAGPGKAIYRWDSSDGSWILVSRGTTDTLNFATEELLITNGEVQFSNIPVDNKVWNGLIFNGEIIYGDLNLRTVSIANGKLTGLSSDVNGMTLRVTYAYGTISQQISTAIESSVDIAMAGHLKTINNESIIGTGNITVEGVLPAMKTINNESILGTGNISTGSSVDIITSEFDTGLKRSTKIIYGIEIDCGSLTNATTKEISFTFNSSYTYWVDAQTSYAKSSSEVIPLPYSTPTIGEEVGLKLDLMNNKIKITSGIDRTSYSAKVVLLYTK